jgi:hypothetical protein
MIAITRVDRSEKSQNSRTSWTGEFRLAGGCQLTYEQFGVTRGLTLDAPRTVTFVRQAEAAENDRLTLPGVVAGIAGGILIDLFLLGVYVWHEHLIAWQMLYQSIASPLLGHSAYSSDTGVIAGMAIHLAISIAWGLGYAYVAGSTRQVLEHPFVAGIVFGIVVFVTMQVVEMTVGLWRPTFGNIETGLVAHVVFFGLPIAYIVNRWPRG